MKVLSQLWVLLKNKVWNSVGTWRAIVIIIVVALAVGWYLGTGNLTLSLRLGEKMAVIGGQTIILTTTPTLINGVLFIPARDVFEAMGASVFWSQENGQVLISTPQIIIKY